MAIGILDRIDDFISFVLKFFILGIVFLSAFHVAKLSVSYLLLYKHLLILSLDHILTMTCQFGLDGCHFLLSQVYVILSIFQHIFELWLILMNHLQLFILVLQLGVHLHLALVGDVHLVDQYPLVVRMSVNIA